MRKSWAFPFLVLALACSSGGDDEDRLERPAPEVSGDNYCAELAKVACYNMFQCCTGAQIESYLGVTISTDERSCRRDVELLCEQRSAVYEYAVEQGTVSLSVEQAQSCLDSLLAPEEQCFAFLAEAPWSGCSASPFEGQVSSGGDCLYTFECANGFCGPDRKCQALPQLGEECPTGVCASSLFCNPTTGLCTPRKDRDDDCQYSSECEAGLFCNFTPDGATCEPLRNVGQECSSDAQCESGFCVPGLCDDGSECFQDSDCPGICETSGTACRRSSDCPGLCQVSAESCSTRWECPELYQLCDNGSCVISQESCIDHEDCPEFLEICANEACLGGCQSRPVCGESLAVVDYCSDAVDFMLR
ncbi:MAG: hypothetical protein JXR96_25800 [Deltaproteobacteria bacterium]|nr:hypothetical protein [Deltaproteobacteria bacterium]